MKILAIRGKNLASLAGEFALELDSGPLLHAGIFAITGPTGAGKSTLLDALCLALFDKVPRFHQSHRYLIDQDESGDKLQNTDVRNILRRGSGEGRAEVDFIGRDGRRYQAIWSVRRSRGKATGRFQAQSIVLYDLDSGQELSGAKKTETLALIEDKLGLDYQHFSRSVLLAQGDFAAFMKASPNQRAELLERMTGTDLYSRISKMAYKGAKEMDMQVADMGKRLDLIAMLDESERTQLETEFKDLTDASTQATERLNALKAILDWRAESIRLTKSVTEADQDLKRAEKEWDDLVELRQTLEHWRDLRHLAADIERLDHDRGAMTKIGADMRDAINQAEDMHTAQATLQQQVDQAQRKVQQAQNALAEAAPQLEQARELDQSLKSHQDLGKQARKKCDDAEALVKETETALQQLDHALADHQKSLLILESWRNDHAQDQPLAEDWTFWKRELERYTQKVSEHRELRKSLPDLKEANREAHNQRVGLTESITEIKNALSEMEQAIAREQETLDQTSTQSLEDQRDRLEQEKTQINGIIHLQDDVHTTQSLLQKTQTEYESVQAEKNQALADLPALEKQHADLDLQMETANEMMRRMLAASDLEDKRDLLVANQPCPLCGSKEHPWREEKPNHSSELRIAEAMIADLRIDQKEAIKKASDLRSQLTSAAKRLDQLKTRLIEQEDAATQANQKLDKARAAFPEEPSTERFNARLQEVAEALEDNRIQRKQIAETTERIRQAREQADLQSKQLDSKKDQLRKAESKAELTARDLEQCRRTLDETDREQTEALKELEPIWRGTGDKEIRDQPQTFIAMCEARVLAWRDNQDAYQDAETKLAELNQQKQDQSTRLRERKSALEPHQQALSLLKEEYTQLKKRRQALLEDREVEAVSTELNHSLEQTQRNRDKVQKDLADNGQELAAIEERVELMRGRSRDMRATLDAAERKLRDNLLEKGLTENEARTRLNHDPEWISQKEKEVQAARDVRESWNTIAAERLAQVREHQRKAPPEQDIQDLESAIEQATTTQKDMAAKQDAVRLRIMKDDEAREQQSAIIPELDRLKQKAALWKTMSDLIGSAEGDKFRRFAQSLTLETLIEFANQHLEELSPRYALERIPGQDLEFRVIDKRQGDETRGVNSLSGGESFLVSLALALGLSSLSTGKTSIDSLFIDEGFGALDSDTLDTALSALDALQATGRCIGLISHVDALSERVGVRVRLIRAPGGGSRCVIETG